MIYNCYHHDHMTGSLAIIPLMHLLFHHVSLQISQIQDWFIYTKHEYLGMMSHMLSLHAINLGQGVLGLCT